MPKHPITALLIASTLLLAGHGAAHAGPGTPPGLPMPCIGPVCVGDELDALLNLPWVPIRGVEATPAGSSALDRIKRAVRGETVQVQRVLARWPLRWFDAPALRALASLDAVCEDLGVWWRPRSALRGPEGSLLLVAFEPVASDDGHQHFTVATITARRLAPAVQSQWDSLRATLAQQLEPYPAFPTSDTPGVRWRRQDDGTLAVKLFAPIGDPAPHDAQLRAQAACTAARPPGEAASSP